MSTNEKIAERLCNFVGINELVFQCADDISKQMFADGHLKMRQLVREAVLQNDYEGAFLYLNRRQRIPAYTSIFNLVPDSQKYELFLDAYPHSGYGIVKPAIIEKLYRLRPKELIIDMLKEKADDAGYITVYRGENSHSTDIKKAISWTFNRNTAERFGQMDASGSGYVYTAEAHIGDVIAYKPDPEEEVLLRFKNVEITGKVKTEQEIGFIH